MRVLVLLVALLGSGCDCGSARTGGGGRGSSAEDAADDPPTVGTQQHNNAGAR